MTGTITDAQIDGLATRLAALENPNDAAIRSALESELGEANVTLEMVGRVRILVTPSSPVGLARAHQIAAYSQTDLARAALEHRRTTGIGRNGNVVVVEYDLNGTLHVEAFDSVGGGGRHAEFIARDSLPEGARVTRLFTERQPCQLLIPNCDRMLARDFPNAEITYLVEYGDAASRTRGNAQLEAILIVELGQ